MVNLPENNTEAANHFLAVKDLIQSRIETVLKQGYIIKKEKKTSEATKSSTKKILVDQMLRSYLNDLRQEELLRKLIVASPVALMKFAKSIGELHPAFINPGSPSNLILRNIFVQHCYDDDSFSKLNFISGINIDTCPYCNRNYIYYLSEDSKIKPQIDHFFPKSKYPFLAISFYNLIPSCQTCNGFGAKEENDPLICNLVNPYLIVNEDFEFSYYIDSIKFLNPLFDKASVKLLFIKKLEGHMKVFKLDQFYQQHTDHVLELIMKGKISYSSEYRKHLHKFKGFSFDDSEIDRMILGNYSKEGEIHKRPLAKLYQDIGIELGLIKR